MDSTDDIFLKAREISDPAVRAAYLAEACGGDADLRERVEAMLRDAAGADAFFDGVGMERVADVPLTEAPGTRIGRYKLLEKIGEGGMGVVYMAQQEEPVRRRVALKIIKLGMDTKQVVARFEAERQALALMDHPNIAKVLDGGATDTGRPYFVMELVQGIPITEYCDKNQLPAQERIQLFILVCQAIQSAHQKGIIHRDIKPTNILVTLNAGVPVPMVIDFGVAKATQQKLTEKTVFTNYATMIGTPAYMSPEQAEMSRLDVDTRSDIYGLGVLLYELLTGTTPFPEKRLRSATYQEMQRIILEEEPERPSTRLRQKSPGPPRSPLSIVHYPLSTDLDWIVMKCLEKDRARRYETANGLATDLQRHLNNEPVIARPPSAAYKFQKAFRRNKVAFTAAITVAVALLAGIGVSTWQAVVATRAKTDAVQATAKAVAARKAAEAERQHSRQSLYAADMNLTQQALKANNLGQARQLLDRHRPEPGEEDLRGWEWRYLWQLTRSSALATLTNRQAGGFSVSFSPDGTRLAVGWYDGCVELWDVTSRRWLRTLTEGRNDLWAGHVAFSPTSNLLVATSEPKTVALYDLDSGREAVLWQAPDPGWWDVRDLTFSQDGSKVVIYAGSPALGDAVWVVNAYSAKIESRHSTDASRNDLHGAARLSPDNHRLYLGRSDWVNSRYSIRCLDLATGSEVWQTERLQDKGVGALAISPDGRILASGSGFEDTTIRLWDAATGKPLRPALQGHTGWVSKLVFTKDGRRLISASGDQTIRSWDTETWSESEVFRGHTDSLHGMAISETAQLMASTGMDGNLMLWKMDESGTRDGYWCLPKNLGENQVLRLDRSRVILGHSHKEAELFDLVQDTSLGTLPNLGILSAMWSDNPNWLCHWDGTNQIMVDEWNGSQFTRRGAVSLDSGACPTSLAFNPARQLVTWTESAVSNYLFVAPLAPPRRRIALQGEIAGLFHYAFSDNGKFLAGYAGQFVEALVPHGAALRVWNMDSGQSVMTVSEPVESVAFAAGGRVLVAWVLVPWDNEIRFYDLDHPERPPRRIPGKRIPQFLTVSPDGRFVAATTDGGIVRLCNVVTGTLIEDLHSDMNLCYGVAFSKDGRRLIVGGTGKDAVKLWDVGTRQELLNLPGVGSGQECLAWTADGDTILAGVPWQAWHAPSWEEIAAAESKPTSLAAPREMKTPK